MKSILLTVNRRLARTLKPTFKERVLSWDDFLLELFELNRAATQSSSWRLSPMQEKMLWAKAMDDFPTFGFAREQTIECARDAYTLVKAYQLKSASLVGYKEDSDLFAKALARFETQCSELNAFAGAALIEQLLLFPSMTLPCDHLLCYGFDEWTPAQQSLIAQWERLGVTIERMPQISRRGTTCKVIAEDAHDEMRRAALQAKAAYDRGETMAIVVPQLQDQWCFVEHLLAEVFNPDFYFPGVPAKDIPYNISSGASLDKQPIIYCLLETFKTLDKETSVQAWSNILHSPYIKGGCTEAAARAVFDMALRDKQLLTMTLKTVQSNRLIPPLFALQCVQVEAFKKSLSSRTMRDWIVWLKDWMDGWGWAQERTLNSAEYQCVDTLHEVIPSLYALDAIHPAFAFNAFIDALYGLLKNTLFQTETQDKPIQVLGLLEAAGLSFDHVWVIGLTADNNPAKAMPHPFIPTHVQVSHDMPHSTPERELRVAQRLLERLITGANDVVLSYAAQDEKGEPQLESPLIASFPIKEITNETPERMPLAIAHARDLHAYEDWVGLPLTGHHLKGGNSVLKDQAACPHAGYLKHRLMARSPKPPVMGLSAPQQGTVIHRVLETLWASMKNRTGLMRLDEDALSQEITKHIQTVLDQWEPSLSASNKLIESKRILDIVTAWLTFEKSRPDFAIESLEKKVEVTLGELTLTLSMDRVDCIGENQFFLMDYKTGEASVADWDMPRMNEPQLPLYAAFMTPTPVGMAFARLKKNSIGLEGLSSIENWDELLANFCQDLLMLSEEVQAGYGATEPKYAQRTCDKCDLVSGCRFHTGGVYEG
ncbi:MAG: PD-(D/E)XK nuclease family protein [Gammaproteobacteria bacterium]